jgi:hypothetical protein
MMDNSFRNHSPKPRHARGKPVAHGPHVVGDLRFPYDGSWFKRLTQASERDGIA